MSNQMALRDIHIYDAQDPDILLGGLVLSRGMTNGLLYSMIEMAFVISCGFIIRNENNVWISRDNLPLQSGSYFILTSGPITATTQTYPVRERSTNITRTYEFREAVRQRDRGCVITGKGARNATVGFWASLDAAHIVPLAYEKVWVENNFQKNITIHPKNGGSINSVQNGLLLDKSLHYLFDRNAWSINPDVGFPSALFATSL